MLRFNFLRPFSTLHIHLNAIGICYPIIFGVNLKVIISRMENLMLPLIRAKMPDAFSPPMSDEQLCRALFTAKKKLKPKLSKAARAKAITNIKQKTFAKLRTLYLRPQSPIAQLLHAKLIIAELTFLDGLKERIKDESLVNKANDILELIVLLKKLEVSELMLLTDFICNVSLNDPSLNLHFSEQMFLLLNIAEATMYTEDEHPFGKKCYSYIVDTLSANYSKEFAHVHLQMYMQALKGLLLIIKPEEKELLLYNAEKLLLTVQGWMPKAAFYYDLKIVRPQFQPKAKLLCESKNFIGWNHRDMRSVDKDLGIHGISLEIPRLNTNCIMICSVAKQIFICETEEEIMDLHVLFGNTRNVADMNLCIIPKPELQTINSANGPVTIASIIPFAALSGRYLAEHEKIKAELLPSPPLALPIEHPAIPLGIAEVVAASRTPENKGMLHIFRTYCACSKKSLAPAIGAAAAGAGAALGMIALNTLQA